MSWTRHTLASQALRGNPLGDPHERDVWVWSPQGRARGYPTVYVLHAHLRSAASWFNVEPFERFFGIWLWHELDYGLDALWIWASLVLWVISNALGGVGGRHQERSRKLAEQLAAAGDTSTDELRALLRDPKGNAMSWLAGLATLGILVLMIWKPGS